MVVKPYTSTALQRKLLGLEKNSPHTYVSVMFIRAYHSLPSDCAEDDFGPKSLLLCQLMRPKCRQFKVLEYIHNRMFFPGQLYVAFSPFLFI
jgi:hypothetical protein